MVVLLSLLVIGCGNVDKKGFDIQGINKYTKTIYDKNGYDKDGYDKEGYNKEGYNKEGYDRTGYNKANFDKEDYNKEGYNKGQGWQKTKRYEGTKNTDKDSYIYYIPEESADNIYLVCDITEYDTTASGDKGIEVYVNDKLIGNIDSKGTTKLKIGYVSGDDLLTVKFHADNAEYTL